MEKPFIPSAEIANSNLDNLITSINVAIREKQESLHHGLGVTVSLNARYTDELINKAMEIFKESGWLIEPHGTLKILTFRWPKKLSNVDTTQV